MEEKKTTSLRRHSTGGAVSFGDTADLCTETDDVDVHFISTHVDKHVRLLICGGLAGSIGKSVTAPLSRLTILFQVHSMVSTRKVGAYSESLFGAMHKVFEREGVLAFWKGNGTSVIHRFPYSAVNFLAYETVKTVLIEYDSAWENSMLTRFISGAIAGGTATTSCYPLDLIRTRLATQLDANIRYRGISHAFHRIRAEEGITGLYRGLGTTLCVAVPNLAINFTIYETLKETLLHYRRETDEELEHLKVPETLACGAFAGIVSSITTFPVDVIRRRLQLHGIYNDQGTRATAIHIARQLVKEEGIRGLYRGLTPELLKVVPMVGITFGCFERLKRLLHVDQS